MPGLRPWIPSAPNAVFTNLTAVFRKTQNSGHEQEVSVGGVALRATKNLLAILHCYAMSFATFSADQKLHRFVSMK